jgi:hypothetical protein
MKSAFIVKRLFQLSLSMKNGPVLYAEKRGKKHSFEETIKHFKPDLFICVLNAVFRASAQTTKQSRNPKAGNPARQ